MTLCMNRPTPQLPFLPPIHTHTTNYQQNSLPDRELNSGVAEIIKYGLIRDPELFAWLEANIEKVRALELELGWGASIMIIPPDPSPAMYVRTGQESKKRSHRPPTSTSSFPPFLKQVINRDPAALAFAIKRSCENKVRARPAVVLMYLFAYIPTNSPI